MKMISNSAIALSFIVATSGTALATDKLPITMKTNPVFESITIYNNGNCPIYKMQFRTVPPKQEGAVSFFSRLAAEAAGIGSFSVPEINLEIGEDISFKRSDFINASGEILAEKIIVGSWYLSGSYCGETRSISFKGDK